MQQTEDDIWQKRNQIEEQRALLDKQLKQEGRFYEPQAGHFGKVAYSRDNTNGTYHLKGSFLISDELKNENVNEGGPRCGSFTLTLPPETLFVTQGDKVFFTFAASKRRFVIDTSSTEKSGNGESYRIYEIDTEGNILE